MGKTSFERAGEIIWNISTVQNVDGLENIQ